MDKEEQEFQSMQSALNGHDGRSGTIFHEIRDGERRLITEQEKRKHEQTLLALAQEIAALKTEILGRLPELHNDIDKARILAQKAFQEAEDNAYRDDDNRMVFRDKDGNARYADGSLVPANEAENITWRDGATSWEDYKKLKDILEKLDAYDLELVTIEDDIHRMGDDATPEKVERLREYDERVKVIGGEVERAMSDLSAQNEKETKLEVRIYDKPPPEILPTNG